MDPRRRRLALQLAALSVAAVGMMLLGQANADPQGSGEITVASWSP